jgi:hypothetical protein
MADDITGMYEVLAALKAVISSAAPDKRDALAQAMDGYAEHFPGRVFLGDGGPITFAFAPLDDGD